eukprot:214952_1
MAQQPCAQQLLETAEAHLEKMEFQEACDILTRARNNEPKNVSILDCLGECLLEMGETEPAFEILSESAKLEPNKNPSKWMNLAQCQNGDEALKCFQKGIDILAEQQKKTTSSEESLAFARQISTGCCSMAEIYCTDCCDAPQAESECERLLSRATSECPANFEAHAAVANLRVLQGRADEAREALGRCVELVKEKDTLESLSVEFAVTIGKLAIELEQFETASWLLDVAIRLDDSFVEVWYLAAFSHFRSQSYELSELYLDRTQKMLSKNPDPELCEAADELHKELGKHLGNSGDPGDEKAVLREDSDDESESENDMMDESK